MKKKTPYIPPEVETIPVRMESPLCASPQSNHLDDYHLVTGGVVWE